MNAKLKRRLEALEAGPAGATWPGGEVKAWSARFGWTRIHEWGKLPGLRIRAKLAALFGDEPEPVPAETPEEAAFWAAMAQAEPGAGAGARARDIVRAKLLRPDPAVHE